MERVGSQWQRSLQPWSFDHAKVEAVTALRRAELEQVRQYIDTDQCRMQLLRQHLDDPVSEPCGSCDNCTGDTMELTFDPSEVQRAVEFLRSEAMVVGARKQWADRKSIPADLRLADGRALSRWGDGGWGNLVRKGKQSEGRFDDRLVDAVAELISDRWRPEPAPTWVTFVPSRRFPTLVSDFAARLADALGLPCHDAVVQVRDTQPQKSMRNSHQQFRNVDGAFSISGPVPEGAVLLVDDSVDSRWTLTVVGAQLRTAGAGRVFPLVLSETSERAGG